MSDFRAAAHLEEQLGEAGWRALIDPANTGKVKEFCDALVVAGLPTTMTVGGRIYEVLPILRGKEEFVKGDTMVARAKEANAHLGKEEGEHLLAHQADIPVALRDKVVFVFTDWPHPDDPGDITVVDWDVDRWVQYWYWLDSGWSGGGRVLRRKS